jgi:septal ring factor EnvC (AmiA/AmiB activator)
MHKAKPNISEHLNQKLTVFGELLETEKKIVADTATENLRREFEYKSALSEKDYKNTAERLDDKIKYLEKELDTANKSVATLQNKLDKAYAEIRELATKTVESASGVKII